MSQVLSTDVDKHLLSITVDFEGKVLQCDLLLTKMDDELTRGRGGGGGGGDVTNEFDECKLKLSLVFGRGGGGGGGKELPDELLFKL